MPTYEYKCPNCGRFEAVQAITEDPLAVCPACGAQVKRLMPNRVFIAFKGPGFHVNDYPSTRGKRGAKPSEGEERTAAAGETAGKPAAGGS